MKKILAMVFTAAPILLSVPPTMAQEVNAGSQGGAVGMGLIAWLIVGLIAGFLASKTVNRTGEGFFRDILLGIVGAWVGGFIFRALGTSGVTGFNLWSILVAFLGAVVVLVLYHAVTRGRARQSSI